MSHIRHDKPLYSHDVQKNFAYMFRIEFHPDKFIRLQSRPQGSVWFFPAGMTWDDTRFFLEVRHNLFSFRKTDTALVGWFYRDGQFVSICATDVIQPEDCVVVCRKYFQRKFLSYIPPGLESFTVELLQNRYQRNLFVLNTIPNRLVSVLRPKMSFDTLVQMDVSDAGDEDQQIHTLQKQTNDMLDQQSAHMLSKVRRPRRQHVSEPAPTKPPPAHYLCFRCHVAGHWIEHCPTLQDESFIPMYERKKLHGMPLTQMVQCTKDTPGCITGTDGLYYRRKV